MKNKSKFMNNLSILYFLFVLMLIELYYLMFKGDNQSIFVFAIIVFITYLINSNMIFVLGISLISINLLKYFKSSVYEGMTNEEEELDVETRMNCTEFKTLVNERVKKSLDVSNNFIPSNAVIFCKKIKKQYIEAETDCDYYDYYVSNFNKITDIKSINWINKNIYDSSDFSYVTKNKKRNLPQHIEEELKNINKPISSYNKEDFENYIDEDMKDPNHISNVMNRLKTNTPELVDSLKILNTIDINQVNTLINNLNSLAGTFTKTN